MTRNDYYKLLKEFKEEVRRNLRNDGSFSLETILKSNPSNSSTSTIGKDSTAREIAKKILLKINYLSPRYAGLGGNRPLFDKEFKNQYVREFEDWLDHDIISKINLNETPSDELGGITHLLINYLLINYLEGNLNYHNLCGAVIIKLIERGLNPNLKNGLGHTFIEAAIITNPLYDCKFLDTEHSRKNNEFKIMALITESIKHGFDVNTKDNLENSIVHTAISSPYYEGNIIELIKCLGEKFDINTRNNAGQNIVEYLKYCIENWQMYYTDFGYEDHEVISNHIKNLRQQQQQIEEYIKTRNNPEYIENPKIFTTKLNELNNLIVKNTRMANFLGKEGKDYVHKFDVETITINGLNDLITNTNKIYGDLKIEFIEYMKSYFGEIFTPEITNFIIGEKTTIPNKEMINFIKLSVNLLLGQTNNISNEFPLKDKVNETSDKEQVIEWLKECILYYDTNCMCKKNGIGYPTRVRQPR